MDARDYLLKPFRRERFRLSLDRAILQLSQRAATQDVVEERQYTRQITFKDRTGRRFIDLDEVDLIVTDDHYLSLRWGGRARLIRGSLRALQRELDPDRFMRVHRCAMVRVASIKAIRERGRGDYAIELRDGSAVRISRSYHMEIKARFRLRSL
jgi:two-component system LytT family response regulator